MSLLTEFLDKLNSRTYRVSTDDVPVLNWDEFFEELRRDGWVFVPGHGFYRGEG